MKMEKISDIKQLINNDDHYSRTRRLIEKLWLSVHASNLMVRNKERIYSALDLMLLAHFHQKERPDGQPYINHPLEVALHLVKIFKIHDPDMIIAALLHDTIEDQAKSIVLWDNQKIERTNKLEKQALQIIQKKFGEKVYVLIRMLTNPDFSTQAKRLANNPNEENEIEANLYLEHFVNIYEIDVWAF